MNVINNPETYALITGASGGIVLKRISKYRA
jgi:hypothetical protein